MQQLLKRAIQAIACMALIVSIKAADASGTWTWTTPAQGQRPERTSTLKLKVEGDKVTGTISAFRPDAEPIKISEGKVTGEEVAFTVSREGQNGNTMVQKYAGKVAGDTLKLKVTGKNRQGEETTREIEAKRKADDKK